MVYLVLGCIWVYHLHFRVQAGFGLDDLTFGLTKKQRFFAKWFWCFRPQVVKTRKTYIYNYIIIYYYHYYDDGDYYYNIYILLHIYIYHCIYAIVHIQMYTRHPRRPGTSTCPAGPAECLDCDHTSFIGLIYRTFYIFNGKKHGESCRFSQQNQSSESSSLWVPYFQTNRFAW